MMTRSHAPQLTRWVATLSLLVLCGAGCKEAQRPAHLPEPKAPSSEPTTVYATPESGRMRVPTSDGKACFVVGFEPASPKVGELFLAHTQVLGPGCNGPLAEAEFSLDATMPDHAHGMVTRPVHEAAPGTGNWTTKGMKFHMPGYWKVDLKAGEHAASLNWNQSAAAQ